MPSLDASINDLPGGWTSAQLNHRVAEQCSVRKTKTHVNSSFLGPLPGQSSHNAGRSQPRAADISLRRNSSHRNSIPGEQFTNLMPRSAPVNVRQPYASRKLRSLGAP
jgi:hypothetical protein